MTADLDLLRQLYRGRTLADTGAMLAARLGELSARPSVDGCDLMVRSLAEVSTTVRQLRTELESGEQSTV